MIRDRNIVCVASNWFDHPTSKHHVMRILAQHNHVLWVNYHASRRPKLNAGDARVVLRRLCQAFGGARRVQPTIDVLSPLLLPLPDWRAARYLNACVLARQIRSALRRAGARPVQLWLFTPDAPELITRLRAERVVYYCVDDFAAFAGFDEQLMARLELETMAASDVVVATSRELYEPRRARHEQTHFIPHGVDFDHFAAAADLSPEALPDDVRHLPHPIFGYFGLISDYVDLELLGQAARQRPDWSFVLIGEARCALDAVTGLANVHVLGGRPYEELPAYCRAFDVGLIPFRMNRLTRAVNPIKLREYLAAGLPVVSTPMPEVLRYRPAVQVTPDGQEAGAVEAFLSACSNAWTMAQQADRQSRQALVRHESWRVRVAELAEIVTSAQHPQQRAAARPVIIG